MAYFAGNMPIFETKWTRQCIFVSVSSLRSVVIMSDANVDDIGCIDIYVNGDGKATRNVLYLN